MSRAAPIRQNATRAAPGAPAQAFARAGAERAGFRLGARDDALELEAAAASRLDDAPAARFAPPFSRAAPDAGNKFGAGAALPGWICDRYEPHFGVDFGRVRIHAAGEPSLFTKAAGARAMAIGGDIAFAPGHYAPQTPAGRDLIAHELAHVAQAAAGAAPALRRAPLDQAFYQRSLTPAELAKLSLEDLQALHAHVENLVHENQGIEWADRDAVMENLAVIREALMERTQKSQPPPPPGPPKPALVPGLTNGDAASQIQAACEIVESIHGIASGVSEFEFHGQTRQLTDAQVAELRAKVKAALADGLDRAKSDADNAAGAYNTQSDVDKKHWIVSKIVKFAGNIKDPGPVLLQLAGTADAQVAQARQALAAGQFTTAGRLLAEANRNARQARVMFDGYFGDIINAGEFMVKELEVTRDVSFTILAVCATIVSAGAAAGVTSVGSVTLGAAGSANALAFAAPLAANLGEAALKFAHGDKVDVVALGVDTVVNLVMYHFGGRLGGKIAGRLIGSNAAAQKLGRQVVTNIVTGVILGRGAAAVQGAIKLAYAKFGEGKKVDMDTILERVKENVLDPKQAALDLILGAIAGYGAARARGPVPPPGAPAAAAKMAEPAAVVQPAEAKPAGAVAGPVREAAPIEPAPAPREAPRAGVKPPVKPPAAAVAEPPLTLEKMPPLPAEAGPASPAGKPAAPPKVPTPEAALDNVRQIGSAKPGRSARPKLTKASETVTNIKDAPVKTPPPAREPQAEAIPVAVGGEEFQTAGPKRPELLVIEGGAGAPDAARASATSGGSKGGNGSKSTPELEGIPGSNQKSANAVARSRGAPKANQPRAIAKPEIERRMNALETIPLKNQAARRNMQKALDTVRETAAKDPKAAQRLLDALESKFKSQTMASGSDALDAETRKTLAGEQPGPEEGFEEGSREIDETDLRNIAESQKPLPNATERRLLQHAADEVSARLLHDPDEAASWLTPAERKASAGADQALTAANFGKAAERALAAELEAKSELFRFLHTPQRPGVSTPDFAAPIGPKGTRHAELTTNRKEAVREHNKRPYAPYTQLVTYPSLPPGWRFPPQ